MTRPTLRDWVMETNKGYGEADMPSELWEAQQSVERLREDFLARRRARRAQSTTPEVLYHYTDVRGLHGMLQSFTLWLSDAAYMNDPLEGTWVHHRASLLAGEVLGESELGKQTQAQIDAYLTAPDLWDQSLRGEREVSHIHGAALHNAFSPAYIASFTEQDDLLSQWRGYGAGGDGVSIGFDLRKLDFSQIKMQPEPVTPVVIKVEYDVDRQDDEVRGIFAEAKIVYDRHLHVLAVNSDAEKRFTQLFYDVIRDALHWLRWEFKSPHYREEKEWRLVANPISMRASNTRVNNGHIVPYLEMPLPQMAGRPINRLAISRIVLGPRCQPSLLSGIRGMLSNLAYPEVVRSKLALR